MNLTNEELILLVSILGAQSNEEINRANGEFYGIYNLGENYVKPRKEYGFNTPSDFLWKKLMKEAEKRNIIKAGQYFYYKEEIVNV